MTSGQWRPHSWDSSGATRKLIEGPWLWAAADVTRAPTRGNATANAEKLSDLKMVGSDGLEPPTLSV
jgi:hypothetical protein